MARKRLRPEDVLRELRKLPRIFEAKKKPGLAPGTVIYTGKRESEPSVITQLSFSEKKVEEKTVTVEEINLKKAMTTWINIDGLSDIQTIQAIGERFNIHPLTREDLVNTLQRPKIEEFEDYVFITTKALHFEKGHVYTEQIGIILKQEMVITFQERAQDVFAPVRERVHAKKGRIVRSGADYLAYALIDTIVDHYFFVLEQVAQHIEELEAEVLTKTDSYTMQTIQHLKRDMITLHKSVWPLREVIGGMQRLETNLISKETQLYVRDVYDHTIQVMDTITTFREMASGMTDLYMSHASNRMNEVMKVLTIISTIFIPLTFIVGVYGMNFVNIPELYWHNGYFVILAIMALIATGMIVFFRRKGWLGRG